jgi:hypothetical protein
MRFPRPPAYPGRTSLMEETAILPHKNHTHSEGGLFKNAETCQPTRDCAGTPIP